jgi:hypothetical protein
MKTAQAVLVKSVLSSLKASQKQMIAQIATGRKMP